jgi:sporulation protein YlmC with PRC-barrel domain
MAALLCLALAPAAKAQESPDTPKPGLSQEATSETKPMAGAPTKINKASSIIGMDVRNQKDEHLGHIKELVIDWKSEQVSYAVISTGAKLLLDVDEKLLAVPLAQLRASPDHKHLILNADKSKFEAAMGFDKHNWPSVSNPDWGAEPVWQNGTDTPTVGDEPGKDTKDKAKPDVKPTEDPEPKPDMEHESKPKDDPEQDNDREPDTAPER